MVLKERGFSGANGAAGAGGVGVIDLTETDAGAGVGGAPGARGVHGFHVGMVNEQTEEEVRQGVGGGLWHTLNVTTAMKLVITGTNARHLAGPSGAGAATPVETVGALATLGILGTR